GAQHQRVVVVVVAELLPVLRVLAEVDVARIPELAVALVEQPQRQRLPVEAAGPQRAETLPVKGIRCGHGASRPGLRSEGSEATGVTREGREPEPHDAAADAD